MEKFHRILGWWRVVLLATLASVFLLLFSSGTAYAASDAGIARTIAVAYDNSGSMIIKSDKWCGAKYSLEVLAAMLEENDTLALYTMESTGQKLFLSGAQDAEQRVAAIHGADLKASEWTEPYTSQEAYEYLLQADGDEKYLVITSDGAFNTGNGLADVEKTVAAAASNGITVIYLAIGSDADVIASDAGSGIFVKLASPQNILSTMTEVANQIFGRVTLPDSALDEAGCLIRLDVPMEQIIVFAQGEDVQLGDMISSDGTPIAAKTAQVKYSEMPTDSPYYRDFVVDRKLQGVVATYSAKMPAGTYELEISGADDTEVYYKPYVDISIDLSDDNGTEYTIVPGSDNQLSAGTYNVDYLLLDPFSGDVLNSDLLNPATFGMKVESGGDVWVLGEEDQLAIETGVVTFIANAETKGGAKASQTYRNINVTPALSKLIVNAKSLKSVLDLKDLSEASYPVSITKDDGSLLSEEEWESLVLTVSDSSGVEWSVEKRGNGEAILVPHYISGDQWATQKHIFGSTGISSKTATVTLEASAESVNNVYKGSTSETLTYGPNVLDTVLHLLPWLILLLILLYFIYKYITKPRLPRKMKPHLEFGDEDVPLRYNEAKIENKYSPWGPERISFSIVPRQSSLATEYRFPSRFKLGTIGLVATKKEHGKRRFRLSDETLRNLHAYNENPGMYPEPAFSPLPSIPSKKNKKKTTTFSSASSIGFTGWGDKVPGQSQREQEYRLRFK